MTTPRTLSFDGCRNRQDAEDALRNFLRDIAADAARQVATDVLLGVRALDVAELDALMAEMDAAACAATEQAVCRFHAILNGQVDDVAPESAPVALHEHWPDAES
jgi:hypothetical protein